MATRKIEAPVSPITGNPLDLSKLSAPAQSPVLNETPQQNQSVRFSEPIQRKSELGKGIAFFIPGCLVTLAGVAYAASSKEAGNFVAFWQQMTFANVLVTIGVVILYDALKIFGNELITVIRAKRRNL